MSLSSRILQFKIDAMTKALVSLVEVAVAEAAETIVAEQKARSPEADWRIGCEHQENQNRADEI
jgi:hypothetical protein